MKIIQIIPTLKKGGAERLTLDICNELQRQNHEVLLITLYPDNDYPELSSGINITVCNAKFIPSVFRKKTTNLTELNEVINNFKPDIIHSHLFEAEIISRSYLYPGAVYITHCHDNMVQFESLSLQLLTNKTAIINWYEKQYLIKQYKKCKNHFIANSHHTEEYFRENLPYSLSKNLTYLDNAINYQKFYNSNKIKLDEPIRLITIGSLVDKKNQFFLVDVVSVLRNKNINVSLDILGDGPNKELISTKIKSLGLQGHIKLQGNVSNVEEYLKQSTLYVHAATYEPFGLVLIEAMAAGLPVVSLDGGGNRTFIYNGENGYMVEQATPTLFAEKIIELIKTKEVFDKASQSAKKIAENYDITSYTTILLYIYKQLLEKRKFVVS
jgi:glycosyltransferase involved in cell wall biosynthesis